MTNDVLKTIQEITNNGKNMEFNTNETLKVLSMGGIKTWSWGIKSKTNFYDKGLLLKVNGHHHKGYVLITLNFMDTYSVYIINTRGRVLNEYHDIFFDMLVDVIDNRIERIPDYTI